MHNKFNKVEVGNIYNILKIMSLKIREDNIFSLSAALAYYIIFAIAPIVYVIAWISSFFVDDALNTIIADVLIRLEAYLGGSSIDQIKLIIERILFDPTKPLFNILMLSFVAFFATSIFSAVRKSLNQIWDIPQVGKFTLKGFIRNRAVSILILVVMAFLLIGTTVVSAFFSGLEHYFTDLFPSSKGTIAYLRSDLFEYIAAVLLFASMFKLLPNVRIPFRDIAIGALFTGALFILGKYLISWYLKSSFYGSIYDAIGSVLVIILWFYYIALIFYLGAVFTYAIGKSKTVTLNE